MQHLVPCSLGLSELRGEKSGFDNREQLFGLCFSVFFFLRIRNLLTRARAVVRVFLRRARPVKCRDQLLSPQELLRLHSKFAELDDNKDGEDGNISLRTLRGVYTEIARSRGIKLQV